MEISSDKNCNNVLREEVQGLRGGIKAQAEKHELPAWFEATPHPDRPAMIIEDTMSGKSTIVPLFAYGEVRKVLTDLFA